jgi:hypothetical protein
MLVTTSCRFVRSVLTDPVVSTLFRTYVHAVVAAGLTPVYSGLDETPRLRLSSCSRATMSAEHRPALATASRPLFSSSSRCPQAEGQQLMSDRVPSR